MPQSIYDQLLHNLDSQILRASNTLTSDQEGQQFIADTFVEIHKKKLSKQISQSQYISLVNRLSQFRSGRYNDYIDSLVGAARLGSLPDLLKQSQRHNMAEQSRQRRQLITDITGVQPYDTDQAEEA